MLRVGNEIKADTKERGQERRGATMKDWGG